MKGNFERGLHTLWTDRVLCIEMATSQLSGLPMEVVCMIALERGRSFDRHMLKRKMVDERRRDQLDPK